MEKCSVCGLLMNKRDSVMKTIIVCSDNCKEIRKSRLPKKLSVVSRDYWIKKGYSEDDAIKEVSNQQRKRSIMCKEYWINHGYTDEEATNKIKEVQSFNGKKNAEIYSREELQRRSIFSKHHWIAKGHSENEAIDIIKQNSDTSSLNYFIKTLGKDVGEKKYNDLCEYRKRAYTLKGYIDRHGSELGNQLWSRKFKNRHNSKAAMIFFDRLIKNISEKYKIYTANNDNGEYGVMDSVTNTYYFYDFVIPELKLCVEFNGDYWHCNPKKYNEMFESIQRGMIAKEIWEQDKHKIDCLKRLRDIDTIVVWESDNHIEKLNEILEKINEYEQSKNN